MGKQFMQQGSDDNHGGCCGWHGVTANERAFPRPHKSVARKPTWWPANTLFTMD
jgi:hypothetical protein